MSEVQYVNVLFSLAGLAGMAFVLWVLYPKYAIDRYRQEMFAIRDSLFDEAAVGRLAFDSDAYTMLRTLMNSHIRYAHRLGLVETTLVLIAMRRHAPVLAAQFSTRFEASIAALPPEQGAIIRSHYERVMQLVFKKLVLGSAFVMMIIPALIGVFAIRHGIGVLLRLLRGPIDVVNGAAFSDCVSDPDGILPA